MVQLLVIAAIAAPSPAARVCADFPNQAAAQKAHDTRDADGDGIFCEALPCPCLKPAQPGGGGAPPPATPAPPPPSGLGISIALGHVSRTHGCRTHDGLPDAACTPGARFSRARRAEVCRPGYAGSVRNVSASAKKQVYAAYGIGRHFDGRNGEVDHLISLELGGSNARANLFPEAATPRPGSHEKDRLENALHTEVCSGDLSLRRAQRLIADDWVAAYDARFG